MNRDVVVDRNRFFGIFEKSKFCLYIKRSQIGVIRSRADHIEHNSNAREEGEQRDGGVCATRNDLFPVELSHESTASCDRVEQLKLDVLRKSSVLLAHTHLRSRLAVSAQLCHSSSGRNASSHVRSRLISDSNETFGA